MRHGENQKELWFRLKIKKNKFLNATVGKIMDKKRIKKIRKYEKLREASKSGKTMKSTDQNTWGAAAIERKSDFLFFISYPRGKLPQTAFIE